MMNFFLRQSWIRYFLVLTISLQISFLPLTESMAQEAPRSRSVEWSDSTSTPGEGGSQQPASDGIITLATVSDVVRLAEVAESDAASAEEAWETQGKKGAKPERVIDIAYLEGTEARLAKLYDLLIIELKNRGFQIRHGYRVDESKLEALLDAWDETEAHLYEKYRVELNEKRYQLRGLSQKLRDTVSKLLGIPGLTVFKRSLFKVNPRGEVTRGSFGLPQLALIDSLSFKNRALGIAAVPTLLSAGFWFPYTFSVGGAPAEMGLGEQLVYGAEKYSELFTNFNESFLNNPSLRDGTLLLGAWIFGVLLVIPELNNFKSAAKKIVLKRLDPSHRNLSQRLDTKVGVDDRVGYFFITSFVQEIIIGLLMGLAIVRDKFSWPGNYIDGVSNGFAANAALFRNEEIRKEWINKKESLDRRIKIARENEDSTELNRLLEIQQNSKFKTWFFTSFFPSVIFLSFIFPIIRNMHWVAGSLGGGWLSKLGQQSWLYLTAAAFIVERTISKMRNNKKGKLKKEWEEHLRSSAAPTCAKRAFIRFPSFIRPR